MSLYTNLTRFEHGGYGSLDSDCWIRRWSRDSCTDEIWDVTLWNTVTLVVCLYSSNSTITWWTLLMSPSGVSRSWGASVHGVPRGGTWVWCHVGKCGWFRRSNLGGHMEGELGLRRRVRWRGTWSVYSLVSWMETVTFHAPSTEWRKCPWKNGMQVITNVMFATIFKNIFLFFIKIKNCFKTAWLNIFKNK